jgi:hypothetical protein
MARSLQHFRRHVLGGTTERVRLLSFGYDLRQAKVSYSDVSIEIHQDILWLDVPIYHVLTMQIVKSNQDFAEIEFSCLFRKESQLIQMKEDLTTGAQIHDKEQFFRLYKVKLK